MKRYNEETAKTRRVLFSIPSVNKIYPHKNKRNLPLKVQIEELPFAEPGIQSDAVSNHKNISQSPKKSATNRLQLAKKLLNASFESDISSTESAYFSNCSSPNSGKVDPKMIPKIMEPEAVDISSQTLDESMTDNSSLNQNLLFVSPVKIEDSTCTAVGCENINSAACHKKEHVNTTSTTFSNVEDGSDWLNSSAGAASVSQINMNSNVNNSKNSRKCVHFSSDLCTEDCLGDNFESSTAAPVVYCDLDGPDQHEAMDEIEQDIQRRKSLEFDTSDGDFDDDELEMRRNSLPLPSGRYGGRRASVSGILDIKQTRNFSIATTTSSNEDGSPAIKLKGRRQSLAARLFNQLNPFAKKSTDSETGSMKFDAPTEYCDVCGFENCELHTDLDQMNCVKRQCILIGCHRSRRSIEAAKLIERNWIARVTTVIVVCIVLGLIIALIVLTVIVDSDTTTTTAVSSATTASSKR